VCPAHVSADDERSYYNVAKRLHEETKGSVYINQYFNQLNIDAHYKSTGPEIWKQKGLLRILLLVVRVELSLEH
jgi:cystathionine beta-synthase